MGDVPDENFVLRAKRRGPILSPENPVIDREDFDFSSKDKEESPPQLSVFDESITSKEQFIEFTQTEHSFAGRLNVLAIRRVLTETGVALDVIYSKMIDPSTGQEVNRPGADGHSSIVNLHLPPGDGKQVKAARKNLRQRLANCATPVRIR